MVRHICYNCHQMFHPHCKYEAEHNTPISLHRIPLPYLGTNNFSASGSMELTQSCQDSCWKEVEQPNARLQNTWDNAFKKRGYHLVRHWMWSSAVVTQGNCCTLGRWTLERHYTWGWILWLKQELVSGKTNAVWHALVCRSKKNCGCYFTLECITGGSGKYLLSSI